MSSLIFFAPEERAKKKKEKPEKTLLSRHLAKLGRKGGKARLQTMTDEEREESARSASASALGGTKEGAATIMGRVSEKLSFSLISSD